MATYCLEPEVPGRLGKEIIMDVTEHPPIVASLHVVFDGWLGDDLLEIFPIYLVSGKLCKDLEYSDLTGFEIRNCKMEVSEQFRELQPTTEVPLFKWLYIGNRNHDDFFLSSDNRLCVSDKAMSYLKQFNLQYCDITIL